MCEPLLPQLLSAAGAPGGTDRVNHSRPRVLTSRSLFLLSTAAGKDVRDTNTY